MVAPCYRLHGLYNMGTYKGRPCDASRQPSAVRRLSLQSIDQRLHVRSRRRDKCQTISIDRMGKGDAVGVEHLAPGGSQLVRCRTRGFSVDRITDDGQMKKREMNPDLMGSTGMDSDPEQCCPIKFFYDRPSGIGIPGASTPRGHLFSFDRMPADGELNAATRGCGVAVNQGKVFLFDGPVFELPGEMLMGHVVLGHEQNAGGILVEPVNNARPDPSADPSGIRQVRAMKEKSVDQGASGMPRGRMDHQPRRFVHHDEMPVFVKNTKIHRFGKISDRFGLGQSPVNNLAGPDPISGLFCDTIDPYQAITDDG